MIRFPLNQELLLITNNYIFIGTIKYAGKDTLSIVNVKQRIFDEFGSIPHRDIEIAEKVIFDRNKVEGYSKLEREQDLEDIYNNDNLSNNKLKIINFRPKIKDN